MQDDTIKAAEHRIFIEGKQLLEWLRTRGAGFRALHVDWGIPGEHQLNLHYLMPDYITTLPNIDTLRMQAPKSNNPMASLLSDAVARCTSLTSIQLQVDDKVMLYREMAHVWQRMHHECHVTVSVKSVFGHPDGLPETAFKDLAPALRCLSLGPFMHIRVDYARLWQAMHHLTRLESLNVVTPLEAREGMLHVMRQRELEHLPQPIPTLRVARLRGLAVTTPHALAACRNASHIECTPCRIEAPDLEHLLPPEGTERGVNTRLRVLVLKAVVVYNAAMWSWLAKCTALESLSIWFDNSCSFDENEVH